VVFKYLLTTEQVNNFTRSATQKNRAKQDSLDISRFKLVKSIPLKSISKLLHILV